MPTRKTNKVSKETARLTAKINRAYCANDSAGIELLKQYPVLDFRHKIIAGYWPIGTEMDVRLLLRALCAQGETICLPCTPPKGEPLIFRRWVEGDELVQGLYGTWEPAAHQPVCQPDIVLMPLLAFSPAGERLGYGGGYYDRTLAALRAKSSIFACGVAYAGQEQSIIPTDDYDEGLDGIITETEFRTF